MRNKLDIKVIVFGFFLLGCFFAFLYLGKSTLYQEVGLFRSVICGNCDQVFTGEVCESCGAGVTDTGVFEGKDNLAFEDYFLKYDDYRWDCRWCLVSILWIVLTLVVVILLTSGI